MIFTRDFKKDLDIVINAIKAKKHLCFSRWADGEYAILNQESISGIDGWNFDPNIHYELKDILTRSFYKYSVNNCYKGISCPCCDPPKYGYYKWILEKLNETNYTFSNIFANSNNKEWLVFNQNYSPDIFVCSDRIIDNPFHKAEVIKINYDILNWFLTEEKNKLVSHLSGYKNKVIYFAVGPVTKALIGMMSNQDEINNTLIDIGSSLDPILYRQATRSYHNIGDQFRKKICHM